MPTWPYRHQLSLQDRVRRSIYELLRDQMDVYLVKNALIDSYRNYTQSSEPYPFVTKRELKPRARMPYKENVLHNQFLVLFCEGTIPRAYKKYIRFFDTNKVTKEAITELASVPLHKRYIKNLRYFDNPGFEQLVLDLLGVDYSLLIQRDPSIKRRNRYALTHFHVKIDWPIADAAEDLAIWLKYIQNDLYEKGDKEGRLLQNKLFEYYGCHHSVGGRRTAGLIAAQLLRKLDSISTVFVSTSEARSMYKYSERGVSKFFLIQLTKTQVNALAQRENMDPETFTATYLYPARNTHIGISEASYGPTIYSKPPDDGKLRKLRPAYNWLKLRDEFLHPKIDALDAKPISYAWVYTTS